MHYKPHQRTPTWRLCLLPPSLFILLRLFSSPHPLTCLFSSSTPFSWIIEWPSPPRRRSGGSTLGHAVTIAPRERRERPARAEGTRGAQYPRVPLSRHHSEGSMPATVVAAPREQRERAVRTVHVPAAPPDFSPSPSPGPGPGPRTTPWPESWCG